MFSRLSIKAAVSALVFSIGLVAFIFACDLFWRSVRGAYDADQARVFAKVDQNLLVLQMGLLSEKADSPNMLRMEGSALSNARTSMSENRASVDRGFAAASELLKSLSAGPLLEASLDMERAMADFLKARKSIDSALATALPRDPASGTEIGNAGNVLMEKVLKLALLLETQMASSQQVLGDLGAVKNMAWNVRNVGGSVWEVAHVPYTGGAALTPELVRRIDLIEGRTDAYWTMLQNMAANKALPEPVRTAVEQAKLQYFDGDFGALRKSIVADIQSGKLPAMEFSVWLPKLITAINTITNVAIVSMAQANVVAEQSLNSAVWSAIFSGAIGLAVVALWIVGYVMIKRRLFDPLSDMTDAVRRLSSGDVSVSVPSVGKADEMGAMASAVLVFKENAIKRMKLEEEARHFQAQLDSKLKETEAAFQAAGANQSIFLGQLARGLESLAAGDLSARLHDQVHPSFEAISNNFNGAIDRLDDTLVGVIHAASAVTGGVEEISQSTDNLSRRTEQQAAALEETAAALEEITTNVNNSARRSQEARQVAASSVANAAASGKVVSDAVAAMRRIEEASGKVSNIIGVIDEIAFQTNLLALNAGVEAARAGEAGKGFAVVAQEVRELAQRSAGASKEIRELIQRSAQEVSGGVKLVSDTGESLKAIESDIAIINSHMDAIATSASEQAAGITQVNTAINQMDHTTQQNAAMVEESNAAASTLAGEATKLRQMMSGFRTSRGGSVAPAKASYTQQGTNPVRETGSRRVANGGWAEF